VILRVGDASPDSSQARSPSWRDVAVRRFRETSAETDADRLTKLHRMTHNYGYLLNAVAKHEVSKRATVHILFQRLYSAGTAPGIAC